MKTVNSSSWKCKTVNRPFSANGLCTTSRRPSPGKENGVRMKFNLKAVYGIFFMNFHLSHSPGKFRTDIVLSDRDTNEVFSDKLRFIFLQLPCFTKEEDECQTDLNVGFMY